MVSPLPLKMLKPMENRSKTYEAFLKTMKPMKKGNKTLITIGLIFALSMITGPEEPYSAPMEYYQVTLSRIDADLYKIEGSNYYIQTNYCYHYCRLEKAILKYEPYGLDNKIIWNDKSTCDVEKILN